MYSPLHLIVYYAIVIFFPNVSALDGQKGSNTPDPGSGQCQINIKPCTFKTTDTDLFATEGLKGDKGYRGNDGSKGTKGEKGEIGEPGDKGIESGPAGPPGLPGLDGNCPCVDNGGATSGDPERATPGSKEFVPLSKTCCSALNDNTVASNEYHFMGKFKNPFQVMDCTKTLNETCVKPVKLKPTYYTYNNRTKPFWMSEITNDVTKIYDLTVTQMEWLHKGSTTARQTLRYHCKNSIPYSSDATKSLSLLGWNDVVFGPPNSNSPFTYTVSKNPNGCSGPGSSGYIDMVIISPSAKRLPIRDIFIRDVRNDFQEFYIENVELCFGCSKSN